MNKPHILFCALAVGLLVIGCSQERRCSGEFVFANKSNAEVLVENILGFERNPPSGIIVPLERSTASMGGMPLPQNATIIWSKKEVGQTGEPMETFTNKFSLSSLSNCTSSASIVFEFTRNQEWRVFCE